jgi:hypothetical protein
MYNNQSNFYDTNLFETYVGSLNQAPHKISGKYKIVVDKNLNLWLDDYNNRRVSLDTSSSFLQQVGNFLQTETQIVDYSKLNYGAFQNSFIKSYHIPFYFNNYSYIPRFFILNKVLPEIIDKDSIDKLYKYS